MPCLNDCLLVCHDQAADLVQLARTEPIIPRQRNRRQLELRLLAVAPNVDVHRFVAVEDVAFCS
jgi:hypothetical protein